ncbi:ArsR/SmtB family transcription factor [Halomonas cupida]|uniref:ArsR/SmtB family transcription factor n=1 Tax=Halomonas cupida TaxID=44933 RepID=UPI003A90DD00
MDAMESADIGVSKVAAAIAEPARTRMLCALMDGHARTSTELAVIAEVSPSTASAHLARLKSLSLVQLHAQGRHRYYSLADRRVAEALEGLMVIGQDLRPPFTPNTPSRLQLARTCYDHMAGRVAVDIHDAGVRLGWWELKGKEYCLSEAGERGLGGMGIDVQALRSARRRFAYPCLDWSMRRMHLGGGLGAAILGVAIERQWVRRDLDGRALSITREGRQAFAQRLGCDTQQWQSL